MVKEETIPISIAIAIPISMVSILLCLLESSAPPCLPEPNPLHRHLNGGGQTR